MAQNNKTAAAGLGAGLAALAAAAAGAYYFYGAKHSAGHRKQMKGWMIKAKGEVVEKLEQLKDMSQENYDKIVDQVSQKYGKLKNVDPKDIKAMVADMRKHWKNIAGQFKPAAATRKVKSKK